MRGANLPGGLIDEEMADGRERVVTVWNPGTQWAGNRVVPCLSVPVSRMAA